MKTLTVNDYWLNPAYLGTRVEKDRDGKETVMLQICAWCPVEDVRRLEAYARVCGLGQTHGACPECVQRFIRELDNGVKPTHALASRCEESQPRPSVRANSSRSASPLGSP